MSLVNTKNMFNKAMAEGFAIPAFNICNMESAQAVAEDMTTLKQLLKQPATDIQMKLHFILTTEKVLKLASKLLMLDLQV